MKLHVIISLFIASLVPSACSSVSGTSESQSSEVQYEVARGYFVRNDAPENIPTIITDKACFNSIFGMAAVMGDNGTPTAIDFTKQSVIPLIAPIDSLDAEFEIISMTERNDTISMNYKFVVTDTISFFMQPCMVVVVPKSTKPLTVELNKKD